MLENLPLNIYKVCRKKSRLIEIMQLLILRLSKSVTRNITTYVVLICIFINDVSAKCAENLIARECMLVYDQDIDFGHIESVPLSFQKQTCPELPSKMIDLQTIQHLTAKQQTELLNLSVSHATCFTDGPGFTDIVSHSVSLMENFKPKRLPAYRVPEKLKPEVNRRITDTLASGIIRPSDSPMACPLVRVLKGKDGCDDVLSAVDYRYVNKYTHSDAFPMPDLQSLSQSISRSNYLSLCDCRECDRWLTPKLDGLPEVSTTGGSGLATVRGRVKSRI